MSYIYISREVESEPFSKAALFILGCPRLVFASLLLQLFELDLWNSRKFMEAKVCILRENWQGTERLLRPETPQSFVRFQFLEDYIYPRASQVAPVVKNLPANAGDIRDVGSNPGSGRSPWEGNGNPLQYSCLENPMDRGVWQAIVHRVAKSWTWLKHLNTHRFILIVQRRKMRKFTQCPTIGVQHGNMQ